MEKKRNESNKRRKKFPSERNANESFEKDFLSSFRKQLRKPAAISYIFEFFLILQFLDNSLLIFCSAEKELLSFFLFTFVSS